MNGRRTQEAESTALAPEPVVAAIKPRRLARSGDSPCHDSGKPSARSRWAVAERRRGAATGPKGMTWGQGIPARSPWRCVRPKRTAGRRGEPQGTARPVADRRRGRSAPKGAGDAVGGIAPAPQAAGAGNLVKSCKERPKARPEPAARSATRVERVSRAWSGARKRRTEGVGRPCS